MDDAPAAGQQGQIEDHDEEQDLNIHPSLSDAAVAPAVVNEQQQDDEEDDEYHVKQPSIMMLDSLLSFESKEPALFALIRNTRVEAVQWYLDRIPVLAPLPGSPRTSALAVAVQACFDTAEAWQDERDNQSMEDALNILCQIAAHSDLGEVVITNATMSNDTTADDDDDDDDDISTNDDACSGTVFHWVAGYGEGRTTQALVSAAVTECLITVLPPDDLVLWQRGTRHDELALHTAIRSRNYGVATSLLHRMQEQAEAEDDDDDKKKMNASTYDALAKTILQRRQINEDAYPTSVVTKIPLLQFALMHHTSSRFLIDVLQLFPNAARVVGQDRKLPLITALEHCYPARKIEAICQAYQQALKIPTGDGDLPLHLAASYYEGTDALAVLQQLVETDQLALTMANCHGQWPLHCAMENQGLPLTIELLQLLAGPQPSDETTTDKYQPVNEASFLALQQADSYDELPLHICCRRLDNRLALEWLLEHGPRDAIQRGNRHGHLPLHLAASASNIDDVTDATIMFSMIIQAYPEALYAPDSDGDLPLHCAVLLPHSLLNLLYVADACNKLDGNWPLHIAARHVVNTEVLEALIRMHPRSLLDFNVDGQLPFHVAAENELGVVRILQPLERPPAVIDGTPALIAASEASADLSTLLNLARLSPFLFCQRQRPVISS